MKQCIMKSTLVIIFAVMKSVVTLLDSSFCQAEMHDCKKIAIMGSHLREYHHRYYTLRIVSMVPPYSYSRSDDIMIIASTSNSAKRTNCSVTFVMTSIEANHA